MLITSEFAFALLFSLALAPFSSAGGGDVADEAPSTSTSVGGDGPWTGHLDKKVADLEVNKDRALEDVEKHTEQKLHDVEHKAQEESDHVVEHEAAVTQDVQTRKNIDQNLAIKQDIEHKIRELERQQLELKQQSGQELYGLQKQMYDLEVQWKEVQLLTAHKMLDTEKQKHELAMRKKELEMGIGQKAQDIERVKHEEYGRLYGHEHGQDLAEHQKHTLDWQRHGADNARNWDSHRGPWEQGPPPKPHWHNHGGSHDLDWHAQHELHHHGPDYQRKLLEHQDHDVAKVVRKRHVPTYDYQHQHHYGQYGHHHHGYDHFHQGHNCGHGHHHGPEPQIPPREGFVPERGIGSESSNGVGLGEETGTNWNGENGLGSNRPDFDVRVGQGQSGTNRGTNIFSPEEP